MPLRFPDFYPRPPRGGRRENDSGPWAQTQISIHALREEGDQEARCAALGSLEISIHALREEGDLRPQHFQGHPTAISIHALREEGDPDLYRLHPESHMISIHALREEGDFVRCRSWAEIADFYPRPPRGGRPWHPGVSAPAHYFYPRPPRGGRQQKQRQNLYFQTNYTTFCTNLEEP